MTRPTLTTHWIGASRCVSRLTGLLACLLAGCHNPEPNALWHVVHDLCVPHQRDSAHSWPCAAVNLDGGESRGFALLKDRNGKHQYLLIPTARITGIETPALAYAEAPNYFDAAWRNRTWVEQTLPNPLPRDALSLAVNSAFGRSQNQLHIHIACVQPGIAAILHAHLQQIGDHWAPLQPTLSGHAYRAMRVRGENLESRNPVALLAASLEGSSAEMRRHTLVVVGATLEDGTPGFILLDGAAGLMPPNIGHGEELQDRDCRLAGPAPTQPPKT